MENWSVRSSVSNTVVQEAGSKGRINVIEIDDILNDKQDDFKCFIFSIYLTRKFFTKQS